jgi:hypothetical protein
MTIAEVGKSAAQERSKPYHTPSRRHPGHKEYRPRHTSVALPKPPMRPLAIAFYSPDGGICHARCNRPLVSLGRRGRIEMDFYCEQCVEHVTLPECILSRLPGAREETLKRRASR